ncbi:MAG: GNAT family N-acetyltransferase [Planctomycetota bacterium]|jgi:CelD/BcsL family acetyltransferase involved in cellulose biosynthesis
MGPVTLRVGRLPVRELYVGSFESGAGDFSVVPGPDALPADRVGVRLYSFPVKEELPRLSRQDGYLRYVLQHYSRYFIDLRQTFDEYMGRFSGKSRSTLRRKTKKFAKLCGGEIDARMYRTAEEFDAFYPFAIELSKRTYQSKVWNSGLPPSDRGRDALRERAANGEMRASLLFFEGEPVAYMACFGRGDTLAYNFVGYAPEHAGHSVGGVLFLWTIEQLFAERSFAFFDFTEGEGEQKRRFATDDVFCADIYLFRPGLFNRLRILTHRVLAALGSALSFVAEKTGLKGRVKKAMKS